MGTSQDGSSSTGALTRYSELLLLGHAPDPEAYCLRFPEQPELRRRIQALLDMRSQVAAAVAPDMVSPSRTVAGYRLREKLGQGSMGLVFAAERPGSGDLVAFKAMSAPNEARFRREIALVKRLNHPYIARLLDYGVENGIAFIVSELVHGFTLQQFLAAFPRSRTEYRAVVRHALAAVAPDSNLERLVESLGSRVAMLWLSEQFLGALAHAHRRGIVHRDIKPSNLMATFDGMAKIIDFGIAVDVLTHDTRLTRQGAFIGTPAYAAPEQLAGATDEIGPQADVFAFGATLFEILTGTRAFTGRGAQRTRVGQVHEINPSVPRSVGRVVERALSVDKRERYRDAGEFEAAVHQARKSLLRRPTDSFPSSSPPEVPASPESVYERYGRATLAASLVALALIVSVVLVRAAILYTPTPIFVALPMPGPTRAPPLQPSFAADDLAPPTEPPVEAQALEPSAVTTVEHPVKRPSAPAKRGDGAAALHSQQAPAVFAKVSADPAPDVAPPPPPPPPPPPIEAMPEPFDAQVGLPSSTSSADDGSMRLSIMVVGQNCDVSVGEKGATPTRLGVTPLVSRPVPGVQDVALAVQCPDGSHYEQKLEYHPGSLKLIIKPDMLVR